MTMWLCLLPSNIKTHAHIVMVADVSALETRSNCMLKGWRESVVADHKAFAGLVWSYLGVHVGSDRSYAIRSVSVCNDPAEVDHKLVEHVLSADLEVIISVALVSN